MAKLVVTATFEVEADTDQDAMQLVSDVIDSADDAAVALTLGAEARS